MSFDGFRRAIAQGLWLGGLLLLPLLPLISWLGPRIGGIAAEERRYPGLTSFLFLVWGIPVAVCLLLVGYLLQPPRSLLLRTRFSGPLRLGVAALLWLIGMGCLLGVLVLMILWMLGLTEVPATMAPLPTLLPLNVLLLFAPVLVAGALFLLAARKWLAETALA